MGTAVVGALAADKFLEPEQAFRASARFAAADRIEIRFDVQPGYYLYREQFRFSASGATVGPAEMPSGLVRFDENFGKRVETHSGTLRIALPVAGLSSSSVLLEVVSQGCAEAGLCYPPMTIRLQLSTEHARALSTSAQGNARGAAQQDPGAGGFSWSVALGAASMLGGLTAGVMYLVHRRKAKRG